MDEDAIIARIEGLRAEHRDLDAAIEKAVDDPTFDQLSLQRLKKRKLALRDMIAKLESLLIPDIIA